MITFNAADDPNDPLDDFLSGHGTSWGADLLLRKEGGEGERVAGAVVLWASAHLSRRAVAVPPRAPT